MINNTIHIPKIDIHYNNYRKHSEGNIRGISVDANGHRVVPVNSVVNNTKIYIFGGSVSFGYRLSDDKTYSCYLQQITGSQIINLSKICNDVTNLYYMVMAEEPSNSIVILDTGVYTEFQQFSYYKPCLYNIKFSENYSSNIFSKIINYLISRNNSVIAFAFCRECCVKEGGHSLYYSRDLCFDEMHPFGIEHPNIDGSKQLAKDLNNLILEKKFLLWQVDSTDINEWEKAQSANRKLNYYMLHRSSEYNRFINNLKQYKKDGNNGIIFLAANPLTKGHEYLIKKALECVDTLYLYSTKNSKLKIPAKYRHAMLYALSQKYGSNRVVVLPTCPLKNSLVTFAPYLQKELFKDKDVSFIDEHTTTFEMMDALNVSHRFFGEEKQDNITNIYMEEFCEMASHKNIDVTIIPRLKIQSTNIPISASMCRKLIEGNDSGYIEMLPDFCIPIVKEYIDNG